jgi:hypothetical protein
MKKLFLILAVSFLFCLAGCVSQEDYVAAMGEGAELVATLREEAQRHEAERVALQAQLANAEGEAREAILAQIEAHQRLSEQMMARSDDLNKVLVAAKEAWDADDAGGIVESIGQQVLPFLPPGVQGPAVLVVGIGTLLARLAQRSKALKGIVGSLEFAKKSDPEFRAAFEKVAPIIDEQQSGAAKKAVDAVQTKRLPPI